MKILIVDDSEDSRIILKKSLEDAGHLIEEAEHGLAALSMARASIPDLIISDILMPVMDGYKLCFEIKHDKALNKIPFIFYTATYTDLEDEQLASGLGASRYILKPTEMPDFLRIINEVILEAQHGQLPVPDEPVEDQVTLFRMYDASLARKLQEKVLELERAKSEIENNEKCYSNLFNSMRDVIVMVDVDRNIVNVNQPALRNVFGYEIEEIRGKSTKVFYANQQDFEDVGSEIFGKKKVGQNNERVFELDLKRKDNVIFQAETIVFKIMNDDGKITGNSAVIRDITARKKLEFQLQQSQKMEAVGTLAGGIAHDFNNILTAILGYTELSMLALPPKADQAKSDLQEVLKACERARQLVKQILTFSRHSEHERKPLRLQYIIKEALKLLRSSLPTTIEIRQDIDDDCGPILADPTQIHQIIMNLCTNAYHAMRNHGGVLGIALTSIDMDANYANGVIGFQPGKYLKLEISDTGSGIKPEFIEKVFEPYFTTKKKGEGTGLGLSVVHGIVNKHGGQITVYSEPGEGTTFKIYFPMLDLDGVDSNIDNPDKKVKLPHGTERLLVVDDEDVIINLNSLILKKLGYQVTGLTSSNEALQLFTKQPDAFDLVITDMTMPELTGLDLARGILALRPDIPIILCSGFSEIVNDKSAKELGIKEYLMKPIERKKLAMAVRKALD